MVERKNIACLIQYDGSEFFGFQKQNKTNFRTVQEELEKALSKITNEDISVITAGRTDTGVHATGQVINFYTTMRHTLHSLIRGVNALLPHDIKIYEALIVPNEFNARFSAINRTYNYYLQSSAIKPVFLNKKVGWYYKPLDLDKMQQACKLLLGTRDFSCFRANGCQATNPIKTMLISEVNLYRNNIFCFKFTANSFLYHMIRNIIGTMVYIGNEKLSLNDFEKLIHQQDRTKAPPTFMPDGLYLTNVHYKEITFTQNNTSNILF